MSLSKSAQDVGDVVSLAVYCKTDNTFMLTVDNNEHWIPSTKVPQGHSWEKTISKDLVDVSTSFSSIIPSYFKYSYNLSFGHHYLMGNLNGTKSGNPAGPRIVIS